MAVKHLSVPVSVPHADSLPNGGNTPEKKKNKRNNVKTQNVNSNLKARQTDFDNFKAVRKGEMKQINALDSGGFHRPGSNKK